MIKDIIIINNFYGFCSFLLYNHTLNNINSISLLLFWCEIVCYKTQIIVYFFWGTVRMPLFVREIWRHSHYISPNFGCVLLIVLRFFGWSPNLILLSIRYILYPLALLYNNPSTGISSQNLPFSTQPNHLKIADFCESI